MNTLKKYANYAGFALILLALVGLRIWPQHKAVPLVLAVLGVGLLVFYFVVNLSSLKRGFMRRSFLYSSNLFLIIILVLACVVLLNIVFNRFHKRFDFTEAKLHSLSDQSVKVAKALKQDVTVRAFFREGNMGRAKMESLLQIYAYHSPKVKFEFIDPDKNPGLVKRYEITQDGTTILECGDKDNRITGSTEEDITNAIIKVTRAEKKIVYFLEGHGEASTEETGDTGYSLVKGELEKLAYEVKKLSLALSDTFPKDCALLVIPGAKKDLLPNELETIQGYVRGGGRIFWMVDPETAPGLPAYLERFGIQLADDLIVDTVSRLLGGDYFMPLISEYESHAVTKGFRFATFFPFARSVDALAQKPEGITVDIIAKTSPNSWSERQLSEKQVTFDKDRDKPGPIPLAAVVTIKAKTLENTEAGAAAPEGRLAVLGDSDFAANRYYYVSGNGNFFLNIVNWLTEEADLISVQPRTSSPRTIQLTPSQGRMIFFVSLIILPLLVLVVGITVWVRRRSL